MTEPAAGGDDLPAPTYQDLSRFRVHPAFRGRSGVIVLLWQLVQATLFGLSPQPAYAWRRFLLRLFGANVGEGVLIRPTARVTYPWKVRLGRYSWIGDHAELYSLGPITVGEHAVVSQKSYLCAGSHDISDVTFPLTSAPIVVEDQAWVATGCFVYPGVTIGYGAIVAAGSIVRKDVPPKMMAAGAPATVRKARPLPNRS